MTYRLSLPDKSSASGFRKVTFAVEGAKGLGIHHRAGSVNHGMAAREKWDQVVDGIQPIAITHGMQRLYMMDVDEAAAQLPVDVFETEPAYPAAVTEMLQAFPSGRRVTLIGINQYMFPGTLGVILRRGQLIRRVGQEMFQLRSELKISLLSLWQGICLKKYCNHGPRRC